MVHQDVKRYRFSQEHLLVAVLNNGGRHISTGSIARIRPSLVSLKFSGLFAIERVRRNLVTRAGGERVGLSHFSTGKRNARPAILIVFPFKSTFRRFGFGAISCVNTILRQQRFHISFAVRIYFNPTMRSSLT